jgi:hypothetical protein
MDAPRLRRTARAHGLCCRHRDVQKIKTRRIRVSLSMTDRRGPSGRAGCQRYAQLSAMRQHLEAAKLSDRERATLAVHAADSTPCFATVLLRKSDLPTSVPFPSSHHRGIIQELAHNERQISMSCLKGGDGKSNRDFAKSNAT